MDQLKQYLNGLKDPASRSTFLLSTGTTLGYLRKVISQKKKIGIDLCIRIEVTSGGQVRCEGLRPDVDWAMYRKFALLSQETIHPPANAERPATESAAGNSAKEAA